MPASGSEPGQHGKFRDGVGVGGLYLPCAERAGSTASFHDRRPPALGARSGSSQGLDVWKGESPRAMHI